MDERWLWIKELRMVLKADWSNLWRTKHEDEVKAEGISTKDYEKLFVDRGEIIHATRDYKPLSFREILENHIGKDDAAKVDINPKIGGWRKFAKQNFPAKHQRSKRERPKIKLDLSQHQRKGGDGWLNKARIFRKMRRAREW